MADVFTCQIELNKTTGITVTVKKADGSVAQTIQIDGSQIITTVKDSENTSKITQKPDSIAIECKTFSIDAETITCTSTKDTTHEAKEKLTIKSTKDMTISSAAKLTQSASDAMSLSAKEFKAVADKDAKLQGDTVTIKGSKDTKVEGKPLALKSSGDASLKGSPVTVQSSAALTLKATATATLQGSAVNVKGSSIKLG